MADLPNRFWGHAFLTMVYIRNRCWSSGSKGIPVELVTGEKLDMSNLRIFGCPAYVHIDPSLRTKLGDKAWKCIFVGYVRLRLSRVARLQTRHPKGNLKSQRYFRQVLGSLPSWAHDLEGVSTIIANPPHSV